jgi:hypothetical protein
VTNPAAGLPWRPSLHGGGRPPTGPAGLLGDVLSGLEKLEGVLDPPWVIAARGTDWVQ